MTKASQLTPTLLGTKDSGGVVRGFIEPGEEPALYTDALKQAAQLILSGRAALLLHGDQRPELDAGEKLRRRQIRLEALRRNTLKRYVFALDTSRGKRIIKISETITLGKSIRGIVGRSNARLEHEQQRRAENLGLAATHSVGFLEWRTGLRLVRCCQIQTPLDSSRPTVDTFLRDQLDRWGNSAIPELAGAVAHSHRLSFFHGDLKGFHAYPHAVDERPDGPASYRLQWLDLGRVAFRLTPRRRIINLYQVFRFILPDDPAAQVVFMQRYCSDTDWLSSSPQRALAKVRRFLDHKLRTHPDPFL